MGDYYGERASLVDREGEIRDNCCKRGSLYLLNCECCNIIARGFRNQCRRLCPPKPKKTRVVILGKPDQSGPNYPKNKIRNQKYSIISFIPCTLFHQFKYFLNLYFLIIAITQFIPILQVNYIFTYWAPLGFVLFVTLLREAADDIRRWVRDKDINNALYLKVTQSHTGYSQVKCKDIKVSDVIQVEKNERVPADMVLLRSSETNGSLFVRTDQLDGETDWKLRMAPSPTQNMASRQELLTTHAYVYCDKPHLDINTFIGNLVVNGSGGKQEISLNVENTLWKDTVVASGTAVGVVIYTGTDTRSVMNTTKPKNKFGLLDSEVNFLTKILGLLLVSLAFVLMILQGFKGQWMVMFVRFMILLSAIIPISLRVNLDLAKLIYCLFIQRDKYIDGAVVRTTQISEELGRISYLLADKTGTLTQNEMVFKKLHLGNLVLNSDGNEEIKKDISEAANSPSTAPARSQKVLDAVLAVALCHNVFLAPPDGTEDGGLSGQFNEKYQASSPDEIKKDISEAANSPSTAPARSQKVLDAVLAVALCHNVFLAPPDGTEDGGLSGQFNEKYQASSPDEVALVKWTEDAGLKLVFRDQYEMHLETADGRLLKFKVLHLFPFSSERKRMGIIVRSEQTGEVLFFVKGADSVVAPMCDFTDWLDEECGNMAREGLRTLVYAKRRLSDSEFAAFDSRLTQAGLSIQDRQTRVRMVVEDLEEGLKVIALTGVEDKLQLDVRPTLESIRYAGVKVWMLTGDKLETALCIAKSSRLISPNQKTFVIGEVGDRIQALQQMNLLRKKNDAALVVSGDSISMILKNYEHEFMSLVIQCPAVVVCRCNPTQKERVVILIQKHTRKRCAAIGDGGNDVSMIQAANAGIGIVGKEGKQASLAADFSIHQFRHVGRLFLVHGRNCYKRSAALAQFVMHRGLIISFMQAIFSACFFFSAVSLYHGFLVVGYATLFTVLPVFSLVFDKDVRPEVALMYPELYKDLLKGRYLTLKTFLIWVMVSIYQASVLMFGALLLFNDKFLHVVPISFTGLVLTEWIMVCLTIETWVWVHAIALLISVGCYTATVFVDTGTFTRDFVLSWEFVWKVVVITAVSCLPIYLMKILRKTFSPATYSKL
ncbi:probable phospholipid-transporting ATPase IIA [Symsagittifera roscoffensis]|uniref:probable phospholipid-transporting ATPase IIA n=1 Tax=Symsagittifera roscoffensis TaxID=84072 RepID=UPI00307BC9DA